MLLVSMIGGAGTVYGPADRRAAAGTCVSDVTRNLFGSMPGLSLVIYGAVLVVIVALPAERRSTGIGAPARQLRGRKGGAR